MNSSRSSSMAHCTAAASSRASRFGLLAAPRAGLALAAVVQLEIHGQGAGQTAIRRLVEERAELSEHRLLLEPVLRQGVVGDLPAPLEHGREVAKRGQGHTAVHRREVDTRIRHPLDTVPVVGEHHREVAAGR